MASWMDINRHYYNHYHGNYLSAVSRDNPHPDLIRLVNLFKRRGVKNILDMGCDSQKGLSFLSRHAFAVFGVSEDPVGLGVSRNISYGDPFGELGFPDESFDAVISTRSLHLATRKEFFQILEEIHRVLNKGGFLFVTLPAYFDDKSVLFDPVDGSVIFRPDRFVPPRSVLDSRRIMLVHTEKTLLDAFRHFIKLDLWIDDDGNYCFLGQKS